MRNSANNTVKSEKGIAKMEHNSIWQDVKLPEFQEARGNIKTDVLIIGGGIAGLLTAYELQKSGVKCTVAERGRICRGVTGNTTAKITAQHGLIYSKISKMYGKNRAAMYLHANLNAVKKYAELSRKIDCDFRRSESFLYSLDNRAALESELSALESVTKKGVRFAEITELPFNTVGAVVFENQAMFNPLKLLAKISGELQIYENTHIIEVNGKTAMCKRARITADKIVIATHFPFINRWGSYYLKMYQSRSSVVALENAATLRGYYMDENVNGFSFRNYGDLLLIGGGAHKTGTPCKSAELVDFAKRAYPKAVLRNLWSAQDCITLDGIPYIGNYSPLTPDLYVATGFNKWGMTTAMVAAEILRDKILGKENGVAEVFDPARSIWRKQLWVNGFSAVKNLLTPTAPRCPHLGCALKRNSAEHTWECPCHGSRFTDDGKLLDNPSNRDLD